MNNIISINNLDHFYNKKIIFKNFSIDIEDGSWTTIVGPNSSGKTTLVYLLAGLIKNNNIKYYNIKDRKKDIGILFDNPRNNFITNTVKDELLLSFNYSNSSKKDFDDKIEDIIDLLKLENILDKDPMTLSGGELQRVSLGLILIYNPKILIMDDAFSMISNKDKQDLIRVIKRYKKDNNMTIINFTDDLEESFGTNRLVIINKGKIVIDGKPKDVMKNDTMINRLGIEIPFIVDLSSKLKLYGLIDDIYFDEETLVNDIWK